MPRHISAFVLAIATTTIAADDSPRSFRITTKRDDDRVDMKVENDQARFSIHSPFGISHAVIERAGDKWPTAVVLRLHLKGLEHFQISNGKVKLEASASMQQGKPEARIWQDGNEVAPLDRNSPYWMEIRPLRGDGMPANEIPLKDGYFEVTLPRAFFEGNLMSFTIRWIDFYRN